MYFYCYDYVFSLYVYVWLPWLRFFRAFSSVVRQMPGYNPQKRGTARTLPNFCVVLYISVLFYLFLCCYMYCLFCDVLCIVCVCMCTEQLPQPPMQWVRGVLSKEAKGPNCGFHHSPPYNAEFKNEWSYTFTPAIRLNGVGGDSFTFFICGKQHVVDLSARSRPEKSLDFWHLLTSFLLLEN